MAATTTEQLNSKLLKIRSDHPWINFVCADTASWSPLEKTIYHKPLKSALDLDRLLHELGHALDDHDRYEQDIELLQMERAAWDKARELSATYHHTINEATATQDLDSYRDWLYDRSRCMTCKSPGIQGRVSREYTCLLCKSRWVANDARACSLRRHATKNPTL